MRLMERLRMIGSNVGRKTDHKENKSVSYTLYDRCDICPLSVYIDLVCNDNIKALVISGNPDINVLLEARINLQVEFSELSGNDQAVVYNNLIKQMYLHRSIIQGLGMALNLISMQRYEIAIDYLNKNGIKCKAPESDKDIIALSKKVEGIIKGRMIKLRDLQKRYESHTKESGDDPTPQYYTESLITISKHLGFKVDKNITLAEYAGYIKDYKQHIEILKRNGSNNKKQ